MTEFEQKLLDKISFESNDLNKEIIIFTYNGDFSHDDLTIMYNKICTLTNKRVVTIPKGIELDSYNKESLIKRLKVLIDDLSEEDEQ